MALPKITTSVQFLEPQQDIPQTLPKIVFLSTEYEELYKANEPFYVYSQTDAVSKLTGQLYTKVIEQLDTFSQQTMLQDRLQLLQFLQKWRTVIQMTQLPL